MLAVGTEVEGSAAYVAIERIAGSLDGRAGAFFTQHNGTLDRGAPTLTVTVVPDSGTGELKGLSGRMTIDITDGKHFYTFDYVLPEADGADPEEVLGGHGRCLRGTDSRMRRCPELRRSCGSLLLRTPSSCSSCGAG